MFQPRFQPPGTGARGLRALLSPANEGGSDNAMPAFADVRGRGGYAAFTPVAVKPRRAAHSVTRAGLRDVAAAVSIRLADAGWMDAHSAALDRRRSRHPTPLIPARSPVDRSARTTLLAAPAIHAAYLSPCPRYYCDTNKATVICVHRGRDPIRWFPGDRRGWLTMGFAARSPRVSPQIRALSHRFLQSLLHGTAGDATVPRPSIERTHGGFAPWIRFAERSASRS
jgi:hypothetical protein